jgi:hypothetical protein
VVLGPGGPTFLQITFSAGVAQTVNDRFAPELTRR